MIQAPQLQYIPMPQPVQNVYQQNGAYTPVQLQNNQIPGTIYNYPVSSSYMPNQAQTTGQSKFNGVNIEILNPQGQGNSVASQPYVPPAPVYPTNSNGQYNGVNIEILNPQGQGTLPVPYQNVMPAQFYPVQQSYPSTPPFYQNIAPQQGFPPVIPPNIPPQQYNQDPLIQQQPPVPEPQINQQENSPVPIIGQPSEQTSSVKPETFAGLLKTDNLQQQKDVISDIANKVKESDIDGPMLLDTQIFDALVDIINKDNSSFEGPTPEILQQREQSDKKLEFEDATPFEQAEMNKAFAIFTIAYMQERLLNELEKRNGSALELKDLPCIDTIVDTVQSNENPMLRISAIAALAHINRPEYAEDVNTILYLAQNDEDEKVRKAASDALNNQSEVEASPGSIENTGYVKEEYSQAA